VSSQRSQALGQGLLPTRVNNTVGGFLIKYLTLGIFVNLILPFGFDNSIEKLSSVSFGVRQIPGIPKPLSQL
jgi:hypothetical protein